MAVDHILIGKKDIHLINNYYKTYFMQTVKFKLPKKSQVEFSLSCEPEEIQIEGNACSIDEETDKAIEKYIIDQLNDGNEWAWCTVQVSARYKDMEGNAYLGCCSYRSEKDFMKDGYYKDLKNEAFADLISQLQKLND